MVEYTESLVGINVNEGTEINWRIVDFAPDLTEHNPMILSLELDFL